ncbi:transcription initiation factor TFIID subunit 8 [Culicoides brevitarsis]|uniref:transcription initiation factor TFIID subunit 8 n=1 Tax=Culicoides brevitarsis TaxID=469753 RepID=UPI00307C8529
MEVTPPVTGGNPRRKILQMAVSTILLESGFDAVDRDALETLTEMLQSLLVEIGHSARCFYELSGRIEPVIGDIVVSLVNMGIKLDGIESYGKREKRHMIPTPQQATQTKPLSILQAGQKQPHPSHIPNHLPELPDPHAYIRTPTYKQPITEYEAIREKAANQKRDIEKALTKFLAKTGDTHSLFETEDNLFPLIAPKPAFPTYMAALNPTDQVFDFEELEYYYQVANRKEDITDTNEEEMEGEGSDNETDHNISKDEIDEKKPVKEEENLATKEESNSGHDRSHSIDNPYLKAASMPHKLKNEHT